MDADVQLVVTYGHQGVLELVHTVADFSEHDILEGAGSHLDESDTEDIIHVVLHVAKHITHVDSMALLNANNRVLIVN